MTVARFYRELMGMLDDLDLTTQIWPVPVELPDAIPGDAGPGDHAVLWADRPAPPRWCAQLRPARDAGGLLARGLQRVVLAGGEGEGGVLRLRLPRTAGAEKAGWDREALERPDEAPSWSSTPSCP